MKSQPKKQYVTEREAERVRSLEITNYVLARCEAYGVSKEEASELLKCQISAGTALTFIGLRDHQIKYSFPLWQYVDVLRTKTWSESDISRYVVWFLTQEAREKVYTAEVKRDAKQNFRRVLSEIKRGGR
jgi:hypothetical protein